MNKLSHSSSPAQNDSDGYSISNLAGAPHCLPSIAQWQHQQWMMTQPQIAAADNQALQDRIQQLRNHLGASLLPATFVLLQSREPIGSVSLVHYTSRDQRLQGVWLTNMFVLPNHRRQGLASQLLARAENYARTLHISQLYLFSQDATNFYLARGWRAFKHLTLATAQVQVLTRYLG